MGSVVGECGGGGVAEGWRRGGAGSVAGGTLLFYDVAVVDVPVVQVVDVGRPVLGQGCLHARCVQTVLGSRRADNCGVPQLQFEKGV